MPKKVLVANRGEIAVRILRALRTLGIPSVAVFSEADRNALHLSLADEAVCIGPPPALESYLDQDRIVEACRTTGADAVHPGYGFLAENHVFAARCESEGLTFVGPPSGAMRLLGNKLEARETMVGANVPVIPGMSSSSDDEAVYVAEAERIGYPVLVKAAAGGGGKGMRAVHSPADLVEAIAGARRESQAAFGDPTVYIEKLIERPRHVEIQVFADRHGNAVHMFERECSIQRRHQKIVEESPSPAVTPEIRARMGEAAVKAVKASGYVNAGTVEFLLDADGSFYFLEVNTRIQVEHPVTEMVTGLDLVELQFRIADGEPLPFAQEDLGQRGHAIECRLYAEDPATGFLPSAGKILALREPSGPGVRVDTGIYDGCEVPVHYDPILSKIIAFGADRDQAIRRMLEALRGTTILGIKTIVPFLIDVLEHPAFASGDIHTGFVDQEMTDWEEPEADPTAIEIALAAAALAPAAGTGAAPAGSETARPTPWHTVGSWEIGGGTRGV
jgi:acetyl-CoA carboxylase biotin carboxylase subunit